MFVCVCLCVCLSVCVCVCVHRGLITSEVSYGEVLGDKSTMHIV